MIRRKRVVMLTAVRRLAGVALFGAILFSAVAVSGASEIGRITDIKSSFVGLDGKEVFLSEMKGKPVLVTFWASWCVPCLAEVPTLNDIHQRYGNRGLQVVGVNLESLPMEEVKRLAEKFHMRYKVGVAKDEMMKELAISAIPLNLLFASDGSLAHRYSGQPPPAVLIRDIEKTMAPGQ